MVNEMILGTVQLGTKYGVNNTTGKPSTDESLRLLEFAYQSGIDVLDTAPSYGNAEHIIGQFHKEFPSCRFKICSKVPSDILEKDLSIDIGKGVIESFERTLTRTGTEQLYCYYLHCFQHCKEQGIMDALYSLKKNGQIKYIGISVYRPNELIYISEHFCGKVDIVQIPINVFSKHLWNEALKCAENAEISVYARSIFLQGLAFMDPDDPIPQLLHSSKYIKALHTLSNENGKSVEDLCFGSIVELPSIKEIIIGCETYHQLEENIRLAESYHGITQELMDKIDNKMRGIPEHIINPVMWDKYIRRS